MGGVQFKCWQARGVPGWKATTVSPLVVPEIHLRRWKLHLGPARIGRGNSTVTLMEERGRDYCNSIAKQRGHY